MSEERRLKLDVEILRRVSRDRLISILEELPGSKDLIIGGDIMKILDRIADVQVLKSHGSEGIFRFDKVAPSVSQNQLMYIIKPTLSNIKYVANHFHTLHMENEYKVHVVCVTRIPTYVQLLFEEEGIYGKIALHEFSPEFVPLDDDLLTLEMNSFFRDVFLEDDYGECLSVARCLLSLENLYGDYPNIVCHGRAAKAVMKGFDLLKQGQREHRRDKAAERKQESQIGHLFVFDRDADFVTPLLTQLTYEGAVDENFGIRAGIVELPQDVVGPDNPTKVMLNNRDKVFEGIRNRHFAGVSGYLVRKARDLQEKKKETSSMSTQQMKEFVSNDLRTIQEMQKNLSLHLSICEHITHKTRKDFDAQLYVEHGLVTGAKNSYEAKAFLEDFIARQLPVSLNLKLFCLYSIMQNGLKRKTYESIVTQFLASHGHHHLNTLFRLQQVGLLQILHENDEKMSGTQVLKQVASTLGVRSSGQWHSLTKKLNLIPDAEEHIDLHTPTNMSYVFNGAYTPAIPKLVSDILTKGYLQVVDVLKLIPGETYTSFVNQTEMVVPRVILVVVLGGVTFSEIAVFRLLSVILSTKIIVASTNITTGEQLVKAAFQT